MLSVGYVPAWFPEDSYMCPIRVLLGPPWFPIWVLCVIPIGFLVGSLSYLYWSPLHCVDDYYWNHCSSLRCLPFDSYMVPRYVILNSHWIPIWFLFDSYLGSFMIRSLCFRILVDSQLMLLDCCMIPMVVVLDVYMPPSGLLYASYMIASVFSKCNMNIMCFLWVSFMHSTCWEYYMIRFGCLVDSYIAYWIAIGFLAGFFVMPSGCCVRTFYDSHWILLWLSQHFLWNRARPL